jgi:hypothetical protein
VAFTGFPDDAFDFFAAVAADTTWETVRPRQELHERARYRSLVATRNLGRGPWLHTAEAFDRVRAEWRRLSPLTDWMVAHVGPRDGR